ncbi:MAG TPA: DUF4293 domain-containing protein, partial [Chitinophagaceae bacterium]
FPFYTGDWLKDEIQSPIDLNAQTTIWLTVLTVLTGVIAFVIIFLYDNRKLQLKLCYLGMFVNVMLLVLYFMEVGNFSGGTIALWCIFHFAILGCYILAARAIYNDEKLIKSMDRLR